jgi:hypothetical protein
VVLVLKPLPDNVPVAIRLKRWLKIGLRTFSLKCVSVEEVANGTPGFAQEATSADQPPKAEAKPKGKK